MGQPAQRLERNFTYGDYLTWEGEGERWELINGVPFDMSPAPGREHQRISMELGRQLADYLLGKTCEVYHAPFDVRLPKADEDDEQVDTVVQPDLVVYCDRSRLDEKGGRGAPDLVMEILSPHTSRKDLGIKRELYQRTGVKEYWVIYPRDQVVMIYQLNPTGQYGSPRLHTRDDMAQVGIFTDLAIDLARVFRE